VDRVGAVGVVAPARAAAEHLAHEIELPVAIDSMEAGVADRLLIGGHPSTDGLGDDAGQDAELAQDDERPRVGRRREHGVSKVPGGGNRSSISGTTPSLTSSSAMRSGESARFLRIGPATS
jgi:hypothetical protein